MPRIYERMVKTFVGYTPFSFVGDWTVRLWVAVGSVDEALFPKPQPNGDTADPIVQWLAEEYEKNRGPNFLGSLIENLFKKFPEVNAVEFTNPITRDGVVVYNDWP